MECHTGGVADRRDATDRRGAYTPWDLTPVADVLPIGGHRLLLVCQTAPHGPDPHWIRLTEERCEERNGYLGGDPRLARAPLSGID